MEDVNKRRRISFSFSKVDCAPQEINSRKIRRLAIWNKRDKIHFKSDVFAAVAVLDAREFIQFKIPGRRRWQKRRLRGSLPKSVPLDFGLDNTFALYFCHQYYYPS